MPITPLPPRPIPGSETFEADAGALLDALPTYGDELDALQTDVTAKQIAAADSAADALVSQNAAASSAGNAEIAQAAAEAARDRSQQWAEKTDGEVVAGQGFSAKRHSLNAQEHASNASNQAGAAAASATASAIKAGESAGSAIAAAAARTGAEAARDTAVAVVTGGTAALAPAAGKIPLADAQAKIDPKWVAPTALVEQSDIGTAPNQIPRNGDLGSMAFQSREAVWIKGGVIEGQIRRRAPAIKTAAFTVADTEHWLICNGTASIPVTLPDAALNIGREIMLTNRAAFTVVSAASNVVPLAGGAAGTAILAATSGKYATLVSDGE